MRNPVAPPRDLADLAWKLAEDNRIAGTEEKQLAWLRVHLDARAVHALEAANAANAPASPASDAAATRVLDDVRYELVALLRAHPKRWDAVRTMLGGAHATTYGGTTEMPPCAGVDSSRGEVSKGGVQ